MGKLAEDFGKRKGCVLGVLVGSVFLHFKRWSDGCG